MFGKKEKINKRVDLELRTPKKRKSFFEKKEKQKKDPVFARAIFRIVFFLFLSSVIYILSFSPFLEVKNVEIKGVSELDYEKVFDKVNGVIQEKHFRFIPKSNLIIFPQRQIEEELLSSFKKIKNIETKKVFPDRVEINILERKTLLIWCSSGYCYIIDENGYAYMTADFGSEEVKQNHLINLIDNSSKSVSIGEKVLDEEYIQFAVGLREELKKELGIEIGDDYITQSRIAEEALVTTNEGWQIFFSSTILIENSLRTLDTFLTKEVNDESRKKLEYVDLRAENKVYYKMRTDTDETMTNLEESHDNPENKNDNVDKKDNKKKKN